MNINSILKEKCTYFKLRPFDLKNKGWLFMLESMNIKAYVYGLYLETTNILIISDNIYNLNVACSILSE